MLPIVFNSPGGDLAAGLELGRLIREAGYRTGIARSVLEPSMPPEGRFRHYRTAGAICDSACAYAFLGGVDRAIGEGAAIGFHQFIDPSMFELGEGEVSALEMLIDSARDQYVTGLIVEYLVEMGIDLGLYPIAAAVGPADPIRRLTRDEIRELGVARQAGDLEGWTVHAFGNGLFAEATDESTGQVARLFCDARGVHRLTLTTGDAVDWLTADMATDLYQRLLNGLIPLSIGDHSFTGRVAEALSLDDGRGMVVSLEIDPSDVRAIAHGGYLSADIGSVPYIEIPVLEPFQMTLAIEQPDAAINVMRLCV
ncbi:periplasmic protein-like type [Roseibacterium elongatum DSM 19469]|uniref:Periplasmic protein-like type n=2 Tax=Roseicyclus elongatus TaxID=159346 RepID=W8S2R8_9RHOB|nr:periplasmic protein-like type [Roseibacterium elongatum DSM 19469]